MRIFSWAMKIFSWALIVVGVLVTIGAVGDPTEEKSFDQMVFWVFVGASTILTGWITKRSWERREYYVPLCFILIAISIGGLAILDWYSRRLTRENAAHVVTLMVGFVLYGIFLLSAMAIRDRSKIESRIKRSQRG